MRIAIIGGIGSGKSEVMKIAKERGFFCISADEINSELLKTPSYIQKFKRRFPLRSETEKWTKRRLQA